MDRAVQFARQAAQVTDGVPGSYVRWSGYVLTGTLITAGDMAAAEEVCAAGLARSREAGDVINQWGPLPHMVILDLHAGRVQDAAAHLREGLQIACGAAAGSSWSIAWTAAGYLCAATGRLAEAITKAVFVPQLARAPGDAEVLIDLAGGCDRRVHVEAAAS